jgi:preprotein translocase subunit YajC
VKASDLLIFAVPVLLLLFMFSAQRRRQRSFTQLQDTLTAGQEVVTTSGLFGRIVSIDDTIVVLETSPGQTLRWDRRAIAGVVPGTAGGSSASTAPPITLPEPTDAPEVGHTPADGPDTHPEK